jgi:hypothetical protein
MLFLVVISLPLFAQKKKNDIKIDPRIQMTQWMAKISSDSELRSAMIEMILDNTRGNTEEMTNFVRTIMGNPGMNSIITEMLQPQNLGNNISIRPQTIADDSSKTMKLTIK